MSDRIERFVRYLNLLRTGRGFTVAQLAQLTEVHRRTVFRDISALRSLGIHLSFDSATSCYSIAHSTDSRAAVSGDELAALFTATMFSQATGLCETGAVRRAMEKLVAFLPPEIRKRLLPAEESDLDDELAAPVTGPETGIIESAATAVREKVALVIQLKPPAQPEGEIRMAPLELIFRDSGWWLRAIGEPDGQSVEILLNSIAKARVGRSPLDWPRVTPPPARDTLPVGRTFKSK